MVSCISVRRYYLFERDPKMKLCVLLSAKSYKEQNSCLQLNAEIEDKCNTTLLLPISSNSIYLLCV